jgi:NAD+ synthase (glutamine-hydrolysing)
LPSTPTARGRARPEFAKTCSKVSPRRRRAALRAARRAAPAAIEAELWDALVLGVRDYIGKNGFPGAILGLSGGIDSALVLAIAVDALGPTGCAR